MEVKEPAHKSTVTLRTMELDLYQIASPVQLVLGARAANT